MFVSKYLKIWWSLHRNGNPERPEVAKMIMIPTYLENPSRPSPKLLPWIFVSSSKLALSYCYRTLTLKILWCDSRHWFDFCNEDFHQQPLYLNCFFFQILCKNQLLYVQSISSVPLDGKYRSATAPFDLFSFSFITHMFPKNLISGLWANSLHNSSLFELFFRFLNIKLKKSYSLNHTNFFTIVFSYGCILVLVLWK